MVSIIVPIYNTEDTIKRCVDSILAQSYSDIEVILVDDGSTDDSLSICQQYAQGDSRIVVLHKENGGVSSARNLGLQEARGEWIGFVDADDYVNTDYVKNYFLLGEDAELLVQGFHQIDVLNGTTTDVNEPTAIIERQAIYPYAIRTMETHQLGCVWCKLYRNEIIRANKIIFIESFYQCEDLLFCMQYLKYVHRILNVANADQYIYLRAVAKGKYKKQDFIEMYYLQLDAMLHICGAESKQDELKGIFAKYIIDYYVFGSVSSVKKKHLDRFVNDLYAYRTLYPIKRYRKISRVLVYLSFLSNNKRYSKFLLNLFSYNFLCN